MATVGDVLNSINFHSGVERFRFKCNGIISKVCRLQAAREYLNVLDFLRFILSERELYFEHPLNDEILTRPRFSTSNSGTNFIIFTDKHDANAWILVQSLNIIDAIITEEKRFFLTPTGKNNLENVYTKIEKQSKKFFDDGLRDWSKSSFGGVYIHQPRPFHNIYDMHLTLFGLTNLEEGVEGVDIFLGETFLDLSYCGLAYKRLAEKCDDILLLSVSIERNAMVDSNRYRVIGAKVPSEYKKAIYDFESSIFNSFDCFYVKPKPSVLKLWFGITGQKRSWIQQVDAIDSIVYSLLPHFSDIVLYIDGMTAPDGREIKNTEDEDVFLKIKNKLGGKCQVNSVIGKDYRHKIGKCKDIDLFVANAGTGCVVPLRFCKKPGVLHSNSTLFTFPDKYDEDLVKVISYDYEADEVEKDVLRGAYRSYHVPWQHVFNLLVEILNKTKGVSIDSVEVPPVIEVAQAYEEKKASEIESKMSFSAIELRVGSECKSPDILREVALSFEYSGDIETALKIMKKALELRPQGPFIKQKVIEYQGIIESTSQKEKR